MMMSECNKCFHIFFINHNFWFVNKFFELFFFNELKPKNNKTMFYSLNKFFLLNVFTIYAYMPTAQNLPRATFALRTRSSPASTFVLHKTSFCSHLQQKKTFRSFVGRWGRTWTHNKRFWRPPLYQLNYSPIWINRVKYILNNNKLSSLF